MCVACQAVEEFQEEVQECVNALLTHGPTMDGVFEGRCREHQVELIKDLAAAAMHGIRQDTGGGHGSTHASISTFRTILRGLPDPVKGGCAPDGAPIATLYGREELEDAFNAALEAAYTAGRADALWPEAEAADALWPEAEAADALWPEAEAADPMDEHHEIYGN